MYKLCTVFCSLVVATQDFPKVTECGAPKNECKIELEESKEHKINCSVTGVYPEVHLSWKVSGCNIAHRQEPFSFYDSVAETYDQYQELTFRANTSTNCQPTFECFASGEAIPVSAISAKVLVTFTGKIALLVNNDEKGGCINYREGIALLFYFITQLPIIIRNLTWSDDT